MIIAVESDARDELAAATRHYAQIFPDLANGLISEVEAAFDQLLEFPQAGSPVERIVGCRRWLLSRFPYQLIYRVEGDVIRVYAFAHQKRRPGYWRKRLQGE